MSRSAAIEKQHTTIFGLKVLVSALLALLYFVKFRFLTALPTVLWNAFSCNRDKYGKYMSIGLVFGAIGDATLGASFITGLLFFLVNHIVDIFAFSLSNPERSWITLGAGAAYCVGVGVVILPHVEAMMIGPCAVYLLVLVYTCCLAVDRFVSGANTSTHSAVLGIFGSVMFVASDTLLAYSMFVGTSTALKDSEAIMITYFLAQLALAASSFVDPEEEEEEDAIADGEKSLLGNTA
jgi:hypothetical protein